MLRVISDYKGRFVNISFLSHEDKRWEHEVRDIHEAREVHECALLEAHYIHDPRDTKHAVYAKRPMHTNRAIHSKNPNNLKHTKRTIYSIYSSR